ncbi:16 kD immunogenic protein [Legionella beliardensis]|uniref:16 kD immunogenic protein n=1 Tax=Legionella beliardensis TaxID=91822 RepID=A0A378I265_9GAMM|nr:Spy/CpxP family protein refolding chaperone [Legionella beliardensis]STX29268.1 16 kD immunogenic protein [Legionella beliardensis]
MFIKQLIPAVALVIMTTQPIFAADSSTSAPSSTSATGASSTDTSTTGTSTPTTPPTATTPSSTSTSSSYAPSDSNSGTCGCKRGLMKMLEPLQLTDAQKDQIKAIRDKAKASLQSNKDQLRSIRTQMHSLITTSSMDNAKLDSLISQKTTILGNMMRVKATAKNQIYNVLNPQQQQQFQQMLQEKAQGKSHNCH